jgi:anthranilate synthase component 2
MQAINEVFGGKTVLAPVPVHGKRHEIFHRGEAIFAGLPSPFGAARYHSLMVSPASEELMITARSADGVIMGFSHRNYPLHGVQFHPESFLTAYGRELAANFIRLAPQFAADDTGAMKPHLDIPGLGCSPRPTPASTSLSQI